MKKFLSVLEKRKAITILLALSNGPLHIRGLQRKVGTRTSTSTIYARIFDLSKAGLVESDLKYLFPFVRLTKLTARGRSVVKILKMLATVEV